MKKILGLLLCTGSLMAPQLVSASQTDAADSMPDISEKQVAVGYYHNFEPASGSGYQGGTPVAVDLSKVNSFYNVISVAFMSGEGIPTFKPYDQSDADFREKVGKLNSEGRAVLLSLGGANSHIELHKGQEEEFANEIIRLVNVYGFDGLDIDLEQTAIDAGDNSSVIPDALKMVREHFEEEGKHFIISMAPEFPYLRTNGKYVSLIKNLENEYDFIAPQLYNQAGDGLTWNGQWIAQNNDDLKYEFLLGMSKSLSEGTNDFIKIPADKLVLGLPSNEDAAANGFVKNPEDVYKVFDNMEQSNTPLKGLMTWSINWDSGINSSGISYNQKFSKDYADLFSHDTEAPTAPQELSASNITSNSVKLTWNPSSDNVAVVKYNIYENNILIGSTTDSSFTVEDLEPNTSYNYTVTALDAAGNESTSSNEVTITTLDVEHVAPSTPTSIVASNISKDSVTLTWDKALQNEVVNKYNIYRDGTFVGETKTNSFTDSNLTPETTYTYTVVASNDWGDSAPSLPLEVTTKSDQGIDAPEWKVGVEYHVGDRVTYKDHIYECLQAHTSIETWTPDVTLDLWKLIE